MFWNLWNLTNIYKQVVIALKCIYFVFLIYICWLLCIFPLLLLKIVKILLTWMFSCLVYCRHMWILLQLIKCLLYDFCRLLAFTYWIAFTDKVTAGYTCLGDVIYVVSFVEYQFMFAAVSCVCCSVHQVTTYFVTWCTENIITRNRSEWETDVLWKILSK